MINTVDVGTISIGEGIPKVIVPVVGKTTEEMVKQTIAAAESSADIIEFRADMLKRDMFAIILDTLDKVKKAARNKPVLFTYRTAPQGGEGRIFGSEYMRLNRKAAELGSADIIDVEALDSPLMAKRCIEDIKKTGIKVIASHHSCTDTPTKTDMIGVLRKLQKSGADIIKLAVRPQNGADVQNLIDAVRIFRKKYATVPIAAMSMSSYGIATRIAGEVYGSDITFGYKGQKSAVGQIEITELRKILNAVHNKENIVYIGFMAAGKTTNGWLTSYALGWDFYDTDRLVEKREKKSINRIFAEEGEDYFRKAEHEVVNDLAEGNIRTPAIVATGGGLPIREENREALCRIGHVALLCASEDTVYDRIKDDRSRPLVNEEDPRERIHELMEHRTPVYRSLASITINTD